jgi:hypothetical protein
MGNESTPSAVPQPTQGPLRAYWIVGVICFPAIGLLSAALVVCMCSIGEAKTEAMLILGCLVWLRLVIGMIRREGLQVLFFYFFLPVPVALLLNLLTIAVFNH